MSATNQSSSNRLYRQCGYHKPAVDDLASEFKPATKNSIIQAVKRGSRQYYAMRRRLTRAYSCDRPSFARPTMIIVTVIASIAVCIALVLASSFSYLDDNLVVPLIIIIIIGEVIVYSHFQQTQVNYILAMSAISEGICGSCAFSLNGLVADDEGYIVCPECGKSWNTLRIVRPHWEALDEPGTNHKNDPRLDLRAGFWYHIHRSWTVDDCGRCVQTPPPRLWAMPHEIRDQHTQKSLEAIKKDIRRLGSRLRILVASVAIIGFLIAEYTLFINKAGSESGISIEGTIFISIGVLLSALVPLCSLGISAHKVSGVLCAHGCCGSCLNDLRDAPTNANSMRVCELCRASWLDSRFNGPESDQRA
jgi:hypothetical protein